MKKVYTQRADPNLGPSTGAAFPKLVSVRVPHGTLFPLLLEACAFLLAQNALELDEVAKTRLTESRDLLATLQAVFHVPMSSQDVHWKREGPAILEALEPYTAREREIQLRDPSRVAELCSGVVQPLAALFTTVPRDERATRQRRVVCVSDRSHTRESRGSLGGTLDRSAPARCVGARRGRYAIAARGYRILREQAASGADRSNDRLTSSTGCRRTGSSRRSSSARRPSGSATGRRWFSSSGNGDT